MIHAWHLGSSSDKKFLRLFTETVLILYRDWVSCEALKTDFLSSIVSSDLFNWIVFLLRIRELLNILGGEPDFSSFKIFTSMVFLTGRLGTLSFTNSSMSKGHSIYYCNTHTQSYTEAGVT